MKEPVEYVLRLRPMPGNYQSPEIRRLARILKTLGRRWGFQCVRCEPVKQEGGKDA